MSESTSARPSSPPPSHAPLSRGSPISIGPPPSRPPTPEVLAALRELQLEYGKVLPELAGKLAEVFRKAIAEPDIQLVALEELRALAHKLRGSAGSYGFPDVGVWATRIEDLAERMLHEPVAARTRAFGELEEAIDQLQRASLYVAESLE